uniref:Maturase K n=1 Tax=Leiosporoceros dussii TaxID=263836 RepID=A0A385KE63_9EMBR|nr:maturase K [Leiosporoceros dussii]AXZ70953.1 maturase K [Leiosporoceros dussii]
MYHFIFQKVALMRTIAKFLLKFEKLRRISRESISRQERFLYPLLFQDDIYATAHNCSQNESNFEKRQKKQRFQFKNSKNSLSFLSIKRLIRKIREQNFLDLSTTRNQNQSLDYKIKPYFKSIQKSLTIVLEIYFSVPLPFFLKKKRNSSRSIHSIFSFLENHSFHSNCISNITIPYLPSPEIFIRIFRRRVQDAPLLHFTRLFFHKYRDSILLDISFFNSSKEITRLSSFSWNFFFYELEIPSITLWNHFYDFKSLSYWTLLDQTHSRNKLKYLIKSSWISFSNRNFFKNSSFHYLRYENHFIIASKDTIYSSKKWNQYFLKIWQYYFHFWFEPHRINFKKLLEHRFYFLGYIFHIQPRNIMVEARVLNKLPSTCIPNKEFCPIVPIVPLIKFLANAKFCNTLGHPIGKLSWTTLTDDEIFNRFNQIRKKLLHYYSGCLNKNDLYRVQYILRFSCAKTLACKHKSTIRFIWKKFSLRLFSKISFLKRNLNFFSFHQNDMKKKRNWFLDIVEFSFLVNLLEIGKRSKK